VNIGTRIKELRKEKGISQRSLAKSIGVDFSSISYWENSIAEPKATYIVRLAIFFDVSTNYLMGMEDESGRELNIDKDIKITANKKSEIQTLFDKLKPDSQNVVINTAKSLLDIENGIHDYYIEKTNTEHKTQS
jgi:transcriptional regulator with XRE-family HTH domain